MVGEAEEDRALAEGPATKSINTGHLLALLPSSDLAASFWHTLGTAVRKGQQRITESMCDALDLREQQGEEEKIDSRNSFVYISICAVYGPDLQMTLFLTSKN